MDRTQKKLKDLLSDNQEKLEQSGRGSEQISIYKNVLSEGRDFIRELHFNHEYNGPTVRLHAWFIDQLLCLAWKIVCDNSSKISLIAVGGYGRGELHPASDIDILILHDTKIDNVLNESIEKFIRFLWDIGLEVGNSVRTIKECTAQAKNDVTIFTNLLETRLICGDDGLFTILDKKIHGLKHWSSTKFFTEKYNEQTARHLRYGETAYKLEPNIKESPGGLRDIQMILWIAMRHYSVRTFDELVALEILSKEENEILVTSLEYLWKLRNSLHYLAGRKEDRLLFDHQRTLASEFGYSDTQDSLAVEKLMKQYYRTVKDVSLLNEILLQYFEEEIFNRKKNNKIISINRRFQLNGGYLEVVNSNVFERWPFALLELFLILEHKPETKGVRAGTIRLVRENLYRINNKFRQDIANKSLFMDIMRQPQGITHELRRMNAYGVLGAYIPAFGKIVGQMQHDLFHVYTVDEHSLFVLRNLRRLTVAEFSNELPHASELISGLTKPERLYIAALFHDVAKGRGGDHSVLGENEVKKFCQAHDLSDYDTRFICWLVRNHLKMSWSAQKQDITDLDVIREFTRAVGDQEHLDNLYLLTIADMRGTSPKVWNEWKGHLLRQLYDATSRHLVRGEEGRADILEHVENRQQGASELLTLRENEKVIVHNFWRQLHPNYFISHEAQVIAWHTKTIALRSAADFPVVAAKYNSKSGGTEILIYTPQKENLFVVLTSALAQLGLSIVQARIHTTTHGFSLDTFVVFNRSGKPVKRDDDLEILQNKIRDHLLSETRPSGGRQALLPRQLKQFPIETKVSFSLAPNKKTTIMEVRAQDRPGLLSLVADSLLQCKAVTLAANISTYGERAEDIFFIVNRDKEPVSDEAQQQCLITQINKNLDSNAGDSIKLSTEISF